jgi:ABC-type hemin transport system substrate-binding protein
MARQAHDRVAYRSAAGSVMSLPTPASCLRGRRCPFALGAYPYLVRLVSLLPSATEIVYSLGLGEELVGVTFECDEPPTARSEKAVVVGGRDTRGMTPRQIDSYVRAQLVAGADLYTLHAQALADLQPDLILTQDLCRVCALPSGQVEDALGYLGCRADVLSLDPHSLDDVLDSILMVGRRTGVSGRAGRLVADLRARLARIAARVAGRRRPAVAVIEWVAPPVTAGHWVPDLVSHRRGGTGPHHRRALRIPPARRDRAGAVRSPRAARRAGLGDRRRRHRGPARTPAHRRRRGHRRDTPPRCRARRAAWHRAPGHRPPLTVATSSTTRMTQLYSAHLQPGQSSREHDRSAA